MVGASERIRNVLVPEFVEHQTQKALDYNDSLVPGVENADVLGPQGQYAELWRKMAKLKKALWDGKPLVGEQPREILLDFIGHCFLAIDMLDRQQMAEDPPLPAFPQDRKTDRERLRTLVGHGYDSCAVCKDKIRVIERAAGRPFDWQEDIP
jgi:hypothetical protein